MLSPASDEYTTSNAPICDEQANNNGDDDACNADAEPPPLATGEVRCPECNKSFKNDKSMFGHLRSHPRKGYKGSTPPAGRQKKLSSSASQVSSLDGLSAREIFAAFVLLNLKNEDVRGRAQAPSPPASKRAPSPPASKRDGATRNKTVPSDQDMKARSSIKNTPGSRKENYYACRLCKATFLTYQALGGHTAGHNKEKRNGRQMEQQSIDKTDDGGDGGGHVECLCQDARGEQHICKVCYKEWHSGQALGGHMRQHFERREHGRRHGPLDIDLNVEAAGQE